MKKILITLCLTLFSLNAISSDKYSHYDGMKISSSKEALKTLNINIELINEILEDEKATNSELEKIHEISYSLEDAIDYLIKTKILSLRIVLKK